MDNQRFTVLEDFEVIDDHNEVTHYIKGMNYEIRTGRLATLASQWEKEGKIKLGAPKAQATGRGKVE